MIRTAEDRGWILLLDSRFLQQEYTVLFPREWAGYQRCRLNTVEEKLRKFWEEGK